VPVSGEFAGFGPSTEDAAKLMKRQGHRVNANSLICGPKVCAPVVGQRHRLRHHAIT